MVALLGAAPALAAPVKGTPDVDEVYGTASFSNHSDREVPLLSLNFDDGTEAPAYCIELETPLIIDPKRTVEYVEGTWDESQVKNFPKVQWVLMHAFPTVTAKDLVAATPGASLAGVDVKQLPEIAYVATQVSLWHFSDGVNFTSFQGAPDGEHKYNEAAKKLIKAIYSYLVAKAGAPGAPEEPAKLTVTPAIATAKAGAKAGPFTVNGPSKPITLTVTGGTAVDAAGKPVTSVRNGDTFFLTRESVGEVSVSLATEITQSTSRVFLYRGEYKNKASLQYYQPPAKSQKIIVVDRKPAKLTASAKATFTPKPEGTTPSPSTPASPIASASPSPAPAPAPDPAPVPAQSPSPATPDGGNGGGRLAKTGASTMVAIGAGLVLLVGGGVAVWLVRRRKVNFTA